MKKYNDAEKFAEDILSSMDTIQSAEVDDFLFTRIQNRMSSRHQDRRSQMRIFYRLSMALLLFVILNGASYYFFKKADTRAGNNRAAGRLSAFAQEYKLTQDTYNY